MIVIEPQLPLAELPQFVWDLLPESWDSNTGTYLGKKWNTLDYIFNLYKIPNKKDVFFFMKLYETLLVRDRAEKAEQQRKNAERKAKSGGKKYTHNIQG